MVYKRYSHHSHDHVRHQIWCLFKTEEAISTENTVRDHMLVWPGTRSSITKLLGPAVNLRGARGPQIW